MLTVILCLIADGWALWMPGRLLDFYHLASGDTYPVAVYPLTVYPAARRSPLGTCKFHRQLFEVAVCSGPAF